MKKLSSKKIIIPIVFFILLLLVSVAAFYIVRSLVQKETASRFDNDVDQIQSLIQKRMEVYTDTLYGLQGLFAASDSVKKEEWNSYVGALDIPHNYSGISAAIYISRLPGEATSTFPYEIFPALSKTEYYPFTYIAPVSSTTSKILGFDVSSDPKRFLAIQTSTITGKPTASAIVLSVSNKQPSFSIYAPIYKNNTITASSSDADRRQYAIAYVALAFNVQNLFNNISADPAFNKNIDLKIYDIDALIYDVHASSSAGYLKDDSLQRTRHIIVDGRQWTLNFDSLSSYELNSTTADAPYFVLIFGILLSMLVGWILYQYASSQEKAIIIANNVRQELEESQQLFRLSIDNAADMFFVFNSEGKVIDVNTQAASTLKLTRQEILNKNISEIENEMRMERFKDTFNSLPLGTPVRREALIKRKDGIEIPVEAAVTLFELNNKKFMLALMRDITEEKAAKVILEDKTKDLERLNNLMIGRELKMVELKKKISDGNK